MVLADKIKTLDDKIKANQAQYREAAKISALTSKQLTKHDYLTGDRGVATWGGEQEGHAPSPTLQFQNQTNSYSYKHQGYCFLQVFRNCMDQKFYDFCRVCYNFWTIYRGFSFFFSEKVRY